MCTPLGLRLLSPIVNLVKLINYRPWIKLKIQYSVGRSSELVYGRSVPT